MSACANPLAAAVWTARYRYTRHDGLSEQAIEETWDRVARALAAVEVRDRKAWERRFRTVLDACTFLPGGRILAGAGTERRVTLFNCFVMGLQA